MENMLRIFLVVIIALFAYNVMSQRTAPVQHAGYFPIPGTSYPTPMQPSAPPKHMENSQFEEINTKHMNAVRSDQVYKNNLNVLPPPQISNLYTAQGAYQAPSTSNFAQLDCFPKDQLVSSDLLPRDGAFEESNPQGQGHLSNRNFFESGYHAGLNTQSSTLKNANRQLRSDPIIPRKEVGPWSQSTYDADTNRRGFEIGVA
jgi:hypothetical protein